MFAIFTILWVGVIIELALTKASLILVLKLKEMEGKTKMLNAIDYILRFVLFSITYPLILTLWSMKDISMWLLFSSDTRYFRYFKSTLVFVGYIFLVLILHYAIFGNTPIPENILYIWFLITLISFGVIQCLVSIVKGDFRTDVSACLDPSLFTFFERFKHNIIDW